MYNYITKIIPKQNGSAILEIILPQSGEINGILLTILEDEKYKEMQDESEQKISQSNQSRTVAFLA